MNRIRVIDVCGPVCLDPEDGAKLCDVIRESMNQRDMVLLDFSGVTTLGGNFLSAAVGALHGFFSREELDARLHWENLSSPGESVLRSVQRQAILFFAATPEQQEALLAMSARLPGGE